VAGRNAKEADADLVLDRAALTKVMQQYLKMSEAVEAGVVKVNGNSATLLELFGLFDEFHMSFNIVEP
jgi:alkyl sulfatase BDS1-like metallo-beta-lactamase superfamily hydrolase